MQHRAGRAQPGGQRAITRARYLARCSAARLRRAATRVGGDDGAALVCASVDMVLGGDTPVGWPIAELIELLDTASGNDRQVGRLLAGLRAIEADLPAAIQGFIDGLAAVSLRHGIIVDMGSLMPAHPGPGIYSVAPGGYLTVSTAEELAEMGRVPQLSDTPESGAYIADFARMSGHDRLRIIRDLG